MKIFFVPNYFYLNFPVFRELISQLSKRQEISTYVVHLPGNTEVISDRKFSIDYFKQEGINFIDIPIQRVSVRRNLLGIFRLLINTVWNYKRVQQFVKNTLIADSVVIVGSDLGNLNVRFLIGECMKSKIPIKIVYTCDLPLEKENKKFRFLLKLLSRKSILRFWLFRFIRAVMFNENIPGSYAFNAPLFVISEDVHNKLIKYGTKENKITVIGMIGRHFSNSELKTAREEIVKEFNISINNKVLVFFTQSMQYIYGEEYAISEYNKLNSIFCSLPEHFSFIIKLHPLESNKFETLIREIFISPRFCVIKEFDIDKLLLSADLSIAYFSRVLLTAAVMGRKFLSINLKNDRERTFILKEESHILEAYSLDDLKSKIFKALEDTKYQAQLELTIKQLSQRYYPQNDIEKVVSLILNIPEGENR